MIKTYSPKPTELDHDWYILDAKGQTLGRLATDIAIRLMGKHKPRYAAHLDSGDNIIVINASQIAVTGNKLEDKKYYRHSGYPGGITETSLAEQLRKDPTKVIEHAVSGMLPKNKLQAVRMSRLKVYPLAEHPHEAQKPQVLEIDHAR